LWGDLKGFPNFLVDETVGKHVKIYYFGGNVPGKKTTGFKRRERGGKRRRGDVIAQKNGNTGIGCHCGHV